MKKGIFIVMILALALQCVFAGGGRQQSGGGAAKPVQITFRTWNPDQSDAWDHTEQKFEQLYPNIDLVLDQVAYSDHVQTLKVLVASGEGPDTYGVQTGALMKEFSEFTVDVAPRMAREFGADWEKMFFPFALELTKGDLPSYYGLPTGTSNTGQIWANLEYFTKYGQKIPTNLRELQAVTKFFRSKGELPLLIGAKDDWINIDMFINIAADINAKLIYDAIDGKASFTSPDIVQALTIWRSLFTDGVFQDGALGINVYNDATTIFEDDGLAPLICNGAWVVNNIAGMIENYRTKGLPDPQYEVFTMDWNNDGKPAHVAPNVEVVVSLNKESKNPEEAWAFFKWYCTEGVKTMIDERLMYFPSLTNHVVDVSRFPQETQKNFKQLMDIMTDRVYGYREIAYPRLKQTICDQLKAIATGESTPQRAAQIIEDASRAERR
jgi:ABC-type glycerol-3-phosphate transport system substrate-binding protein